MKLKANLFIVASFAAFQSIAYSAPLYKVNNSDNLNLTSSWTVTPILLDPPASIGTSDALYFNESNMQGDKTLALGTGGLSVGGLAVDFATTDSANNVVISAGNTLTLNGTSLGGSGVAGTSYSGAGIVLNRGTGGNLTINSDVALGAAQQWVSGRATGGITVAGAVNLGSFNLTTNIAAGTSTISGAISGSGKFTKSGAGTLTLPNANTSTGGFQLGPDAGSANVGVVVAGNANSFGTTPIISRGTQLRSSVADLVIPNNISVGAGGFRLGGTNNFNLSGTTTLDGAGRSIANYGTNTVTLGGIATVTSSVATFDAASGRIVVSGPITGAGGISISTGDIVLNGTNTYAGTSLMSGGRLSGTGTIPTLLTLSGGTLGLAGGATTGSALTFGAGATITNTPAIAFQTAPLAATTYDVFNYSGTLTGLANLKSPFRGTFANTGSKVTFTTGAANQALTWNGITGTWDGIGANANWTGSDTKFYNGDAATFPEPAAAATVTVSGTVSATGFAITNTTNAYTFTGGAITGTTGVVKSGTGTATLASAANSFTGNIIVNGGTLVGSTSTGGINSTLGLNSSTRSITVNTGGTLSMSTNNILGSGTQTLANTTKLIVSGGTVTTTNFNVVGDVDLNGGTLAATGGASTAYRSYEFNGSTVTVGGSIASTISATGANSEMHIAGTKTLTLAVGDVVAGTDLNLSAALRDGSNDRPGAGTLLKTGLGTVVSSGANAYTGATTISGGAFLVSGSSTGGGSITVDSGSTFGTTGAGFIGTSGVRSVGITNNGALSFSSSAAQTISGAISGTGSLTKSGSGVLTLSGTNTHTGPTSINGGKLVVIGSLPVESAVTVGSGGILSGDGFVFGDVTVNAGGAFAVGSLSGYGLSVGNITFADTATIQISELGNYTGIAPLETTGNLTVSGGAGSVTVNLPVVPISAGVYHLIGSNNTLANADQFVLGITPSLGSRQSGVLKANAGFIDYEVTGINPTWTGGFDGEWSTASMASPKNWFTNVETDFIPGDAVTFPDMATTYAITLPAVVNPALVIFDNSTTPYTLSGPGGIAGAGTSLAKNGTSEVTLNTVNTYGGGTTINDGKLTMGNAAAIGSGPVTLGAATLSLAGYTLPNNIASTGGTLSGSTFQVDGVISGTSLTINATGIVKFSAVNTYTGATTITSGGLEITGAGQLNSGNYAGAITNPALLRFSTSANQTLSGVISGTGQLVKNNTNTLTLTNNSSYTGTTTVNAGTIKMGNNNALGAFLAGRPVTQVVVNPGGAVDFNASAGTYGYTIAGSGVGGTGALTNSGGAVGNNLAQASNILLSADASIGGATNWSLLTNGWNATTLDLGGFTLTKTGANTIGLVSATTTAGTLRVSSGTLTLGVTDGGSGVTGSASAFSLDNTAGVAMSMIKPSSLGSLAGGGATGGNVTLASVTTLTVGALDTSTTYGGIISGAGAFTKTGLGTLLLTAANSYTGTTTINAGTVDLSTTGQLYTGAYANSTVTINTGGTLKIKNMAYNVTAGSAASLGGLRDYGAARFINGGTFEVLGAGDYSTGNNFSTSANGGTFRFAPAVTTETLTLTGNGNSNIDLAGALTLDAVGNVAISEIIDGAGSLTKTGAGTLTLAANTYTGATTVTAGVLAVNGSSLANAASLTVNGGKVNLTNNETVDTLYFGATQKAAGTWGSSLSVPTPTHIDDTHFSGTGILTVTNGPVAVNGYDAWSAQITNGKTLRGQDADDDGFTNLQEFLFGTNPMASTGSLTTTERTNDGLVIRWSERTTNATYKLLQSTTLANPWSQWVPTGAPHIIEIDGAPAGDYQPKKATVPVDQSKNFFRVEGVEN